MCKANPEAADGHFLVLRELCIYYKTEFCCLRNSSFYASFTMKKRHSSSVTYPKIILVGINKREIRKGKTNMGKVYSFQLLLDKLPTFVSLATIFF